MGFAQRLTGMQDIVQVCVHSLDHKIDVLPRAPVYGWYHDIYQPENILMVEVPKQPLRCATEHTTAP